MADVASDLKTWSTTASSNTPTTATTIGTGLAPNLQEIQKVVRQDLAHKGADIASATTTDIGAVAGLMHDITGTTTITGLGTVSAGIWKVLKFEGALTLTHNATSLILPGAANITTANGDVAIVISEGSGNWRCLSYMRADGTAISGGGIADGSVTLAKMANLAQDQFIGRTTASTGVPETATITAAARTVLDDTSVSAMRTTLGAAALDVGAGGIGAMMIMKNGSGSSVSSGSTVAGTSLTYATFNDTGFSGTGAAATGTWRNIGGDSVANNSYGTFQRIS